MLPLISSRRNPLVAELRALVRRRPHHSRRILLDGPHLVDAALSTRLPVLAAVVARARLATDGEIARLAAALTERGVHVASATDSVMNAISPVVSASGIVALAEYRPRSLETLLDRQPALIAWLHNVQDPGNVGAVIRTAEAAGATGVIVSGASADPFGWKALRGAMGSTLRLPVVRTAHASDVLDQLRRRAVRLLAAAPRGGCPIYDVDWRGPLAICLGSEGAGLSPQIARRAEQLVSVPMERPVESLNVAVTAALLLYEARRQRTGSAPFRPATEQIP